MPRINAPKPSVRNTSSYVEVSDRTLFVPTTEAETEPVSSLLAETQYPNARAVKEAAQAYSAKRSMCSAPRETRTPLAQGVGQ